MRINTKYLLVLVSVLLAVGSLSAHAQGVDTVKLQVLMIKAQNDAAPIDRRLEKVEYKLRRVFGFQYYSFVGQGSIILTPYGEGVVDLANGHHVSVKLAGKGKKAEIHWYTDEKPLLSTSVGLSREGPVVLGGVPSDDGKLILVLTVHD